MQQRFQAKLKQHPALDHPNICTIYEVGNHESQPFIALCSSSTGRP